MVDRNHGFSDFDPAWSFDEALTHADTTKGRLCPFMRWEYWRALHEEIKQGFDAGSPRALLLALRDCACFDLPMPDWVADNYIKGFDKWNLLATKTLDEAFNVARPRNFHFGRARRNDALTLQISRAVHSAEARGVPIDQGFFDELGADLNTSGGTAKRLYYAKKNIYRRNRPPSVTVPKLLQPYVTKGIPKKA